MEFTLDVEQVRAVLGAEYREARADLSRLGPIGALAASGQRHERRIASAPDAASLACKAGCAWCCHFTIDVRAAEVFSILDFVQREFDDSQQARVMSEISANAEFLASLGDDERVTRNIACPFLVDSRCSIYEVRPQSCRNYHATDSAGCEESYRDPENLDIDPDFAPGVYQAGTAHVEAWSAALRDAGLDIAAYELNSALHAALSTDGARSRYLAGGQPFPTLHGEDVGEEFDDLWG